MKSGELRVLLVTLLLLAVLVGLALSPQAQAQEQPPAILKWTEVDTPGAKGNVIVTPSEVSRIAAGRGDVLYASDNSTDKVYRSDNGGLTWTDITRGLQSAGALLPASEIAVAPDRPQNVAVVTNNRTKVYASTDSGASWSDTNVPPLAAGATIQCITISKTYRMTDTMWDIAIGTKDGANGDVYVLKAPGFGGWLPQGIGVLMGAGPYDFFAVRFSPTYSGDSGLAFVSANVTGTWYNIALRDINANTTLSLALPPPGIEVKDPTWAGNASPDVGTLNEASLELPSDFSATAVSLRRAYIATDSNGSGAAKAVTARDGVFRIDTTVYTLMDTSQDVNKSICSIAYFGTYADGKLLAGEVNAVPPPVQAVQVWRSLNPYGPSPSWQPATQPPSGPGNAQVAWSYQGRMAFCGTGQSPGVALDESAFSRSVDDGDTWEQASLIDTVINISDIAPAPDSTCFWLHIAALA